MKAFLRRLRSPVLAALAFVLVFILMACPSTTAPTGTEANELIMQENSSSLVLSTGVVATNKAGFTGDGFYSSMTVGGTPSRLVYTVNAAAAGDYQLSVRYAFGGTETNLRDAYVIVNGARTTIGTDNLLKFAYTDSGWAVWAETEPVTVTLLQGDNQIRIQAAHGEQRVITLLSGATATGTVTSLPNVDYVKLSGEGLTPGNNSLVFYSLATSVLSDGTDSVHGSITVDPVQDFYVGGTTVTLTASENAGWQFDSWTGTAPMDTAEYTITMNKDYSLAARFVPEGATHPDGLLGYGSIQDDNAVPYMLTGGLGGQTYTVTSVSELEAALSTTTYAGPRVITVDGCIDNSGLPSKSLTVPSNTSLYGDLTNGGWIRNIELKFSGHNYIVKNMKFSEVVGVATANITEGTGNDAMQLNGARHVWIDHCEFHSNLNPDLDGYTGDVKDFYDGLLDIKNGASFITISNSYFHDHYKAILVGSGDDPTNAATDTYIRLTMHSNYFKDVNSRLPLIRFGKAHIFNNYILGDTMQVDSTVNVRCGAEVYYENNLTVNAKKTVGFYYDTGSYPTGLWNLSGNIFTNCVETPGASTTSWTPPYTYDGIVVPADSLAASLPDSTGVGKIPSLD